MRSKLAQILEGRSLACSAPTLATGELLPGGPFYFSFWPVGVPWRELISMRKAVSEVGMQGT